MTILLGSCSRSGPQFAEVAGRVMFEGKPLPFAKVEFQPPGARSSSGITGRDGAYALGYSFSQTGAIIGHHVVRIAFAPSDELEPADAREAAALRKQITIPAKFNRDSELTADVKDDRNMFDFVLTGD